MEIKQLLLNSSYETAGKAARWLDPREPGMKNRDKSETEERRWTENVKKEETDTLFWLQTAERKPKTRWGHLMCVDSGATLTNHKILGALKCFSAPS